MQSEAQTLLMLVPCCTWLMNYRLIICLLILQHRMSSTKLAKSRMSLAQLPLPSTTSLKMNPVRPMWRLNQRLHPPTSLWWQWRDARPSSSWTGRRLTMKPLVLTGRIFYCSSPTKKLNETEALWWSFCGFSCVISSSCWSWPHSVILVSEYEVISTAKGPDGEQVSILTTNQTHTAVENLKPESR